MSTIEHYVREMYREWRNDLNGQSGRANGPELRPSVRTTGGRRVGPGSRLRRNRLSERRFPGTDVARVHRCGGRSESRFLEKSSNGKGEPGVTGLAYCLPYR